jgi:histidinol phosphatase-like PHP family hydrolase
MINYEDMYSALLEEINKIMKERNIDNYECPRNGKYMNTIQFLRSQLEDIAILIGTEYNYQYMKLW